MKKSILKTSAVIVILVLIVGDRIGNTATDMQTAKYQEPQRVITIEDEEVPLAANPFAQINEDQSISDNSLEDGNAKKAE